MLHNYILEVEGDDGEEFENDAISDDEEDDEDEVDEFYNLDDDRDAVAKRDRIARSLWLDWDYRK